MLTGLAQIHASLLALDAHNADGTAARGLRVTVYDPDTVSEFNVGRQLFYTSDIGLNKAVCLVHRVNMAYGTDWSAVPGEFVQQTKESNTWSARSPEILITCTDTAKSRREVHKFLWGAPSWKVNYWLDCANLATVGQVVLGQPGHAKEDGWPSRLAYDPALVRWKGHRAVQVRDADGLYNQLNFKKDIEIRLPCVTELFDKNFDETNEPSCSMVDALKKQSLFVNRTVSAYALDLLWELLRDGSVGNQGCYFSLRTRTANPIPLKVWPVAGKAGATWGQSTLE